MKFQILGDEETYGKMALTGLLAGGVLGASGVLLAEVIGDVLAIAGIVYAVAWLYKKFRL